MKQTIIGFILILLLKFSSFGQTSEFENIFSNCRLKQLKDNSLIDIDFIEKANGKTIVLKSVVKGCKWILEEMAYYNYLKSKHSDKLDVFVSFSDDTLTMSKYIKEVGFDFIYLYDPEQILNKKHFSKDTIYSVLFDSYGDIQQIDYSGKLNHDKILNQLDEPTNKTSRSIPLLNFQIKRFELGDEVTSNLSSANIPTKLMTGYKVDENIDTIESIKFYILTGENILGLYSHAYDLPKNRIIYDKELEYINSHAPNHRYTLSLSVSNLHADFNKMLIQQIDLNFGLETSLIIKETESLILSKIDLEKDKIKRANPLDKNKTLNKTISETKFQLKSDNINALEISRLIEETTKFPVEIKFDPNLNFSLDISIENNDKTIDNWIKLFSENGLNLYKEMKKVKYLKIENDSRY